MSLAQLPRSSRINLSTGCGILIALVCVLAPARAAASNDEPLAPVAAEPDAAATDTAEPPAEPANEPVAEPAPAPADSLWTRKALTGDWWGARTTLKDAGVTFRLTYQGQYMLNARGALETTNGTDSAGTYDATLLLNLDKMFGLAGAEIFFRGKGTWGGDVSDFDREKIGGLFRTNGDSSPELAIYVDKYWWRQQLFEDRVEIRIGKISDADLFALNDVAGSEDTQFLNAGLNGVANVAGATGHGVSVNVWPVDWLYTRAAIIDSDARRGNASFESAFHDRAYYNVYGEFGILPQFIAPEILPGTYRFGYWFEPGEFPVYFNDLGGRRAPRSTWDNHGFYLSFDQELWEENPDDPKDNQGLAAFAIYGYAHAENNFLEHAWSAGVQYIGLVPSRDKDVLGFGVAQGIVSGDFRREIDDVFDRETVYEMYYKIELTPWMALTPDIQVITNPGGRQDRDTAIVGGLRLRVNF